MPAVQEDLALGLVLRLLNPDGLDAIREHAEKLPARGRTPRVKAFLEQFEASRATVATAIAYLQNRDSTASHRICSRGFLPEGQRFRSLEVYAGAEEGEDPLAWAFGALGTQDRARHLATLYLNDLAD
ncbi:MAG: radical SAM protein, partial [Nevskia sp.]|nr:radical SAM protein [Nevskia sp.]